MNDWHGFARWCVILFGRKRILPATGKGVYLCRIYWRRERKWEPRSRFISFLLR